MHNVRRRAQTIALAAAVAAVAFVALITYASAIGHQGCLRDKATIAALRAIIDRSSKVTLPEFEREGTLTAAQVRRAQATNRRDLKKLEVPSC